MSVIYPFKARQKPVQKTGQTATRPVSGKQISDTQALQELIEILKKPFLTNCHRCNGKGVVVLKKGHTENKQTCASCKGTGTFQMQLI